MSRLVQIEVPWFYIAEVFARETQCNLREKTQRGFGGEREFTTLPQNKVCWVQGRQFALHIVEVFLFIVFFFLIFFCFVLATHGIVHFECGIVHYYAQVFCTRREKKCPSPRECVLRHYLRKLNTHNVKLIPCLFYFRELELIEIWAHWFELWLYALLKSRLVIHTLVGFRAYLELMWCTVSSADQAQ